MASASLLRAASSAGHAAVNHRGCVRRPEFTVFNAVVSPIAKRRTAVRPSRPSRSRVVSVSADATSLAVAPKPLPDLAQVKLTARAKKATDIAVRFAFSSQTYEVHTWHLVLGLLQVKDGLSASVLRDAGLDLEEAFMEVLYCLKMSDALEPKAFQHDVAFTNKATYVLEHAVWIARCLGHPQVDAEHLLAALAFYEVPRDLFPDVDLSEERVWKALHNAWDARGLSTDRHLLQKQAKRLEQLFRERSHTKYSFPALGKFQHLGPFA